LNLRKGYPVPLDSVTVYLVVEGEAIDTTGSYRVYSKGDFLADHTIMSLINRQWSAQDGKFVAHSDLLKLAKVEKQTFYS
jgi:hypothetical protein